MNSPREVLKISGESGFKKEKYSVSKLLVLAFLAGAYIAFGGLLAIVVGGGSPGIAAENPGLAKFLFGGVFPVGLILVVLVGAELFTGNTAYFMPNLFQGLQKPSAMFRNWFWVYIGNFFGSIFVAYVLVHLTHLVSSEPYINSVYSIAAGKTGHGFMVTFIKGVGANWLVCLALWQGMAAKTVGGKILAIWFPVMAFVTLGFEHSIANMFFIPLAIFEGAEITWFTFVTANLIPATLGNIVGGGLFVGAVYSYLYLDKR
ncbi:MAG: formate transporter [Proteobacteria bacterium]|nr:MAG: formate transporter [Pseudomonadota bacterium]